MDHVLTDEVLVAMARAARERLGASVAFDRRTLLRAGCRNHVYRVRATGAGVGSAIVKVIVHDPDRAMVEWAGLQFLSSAPDTRPVAPELYGYDVAARACVMEDLGVSPSLADLLAGTDAAAVEAAAEAMAREMARLAAATLGREGDFDRYRHAVPAARTDRRGEASEWLRRSAALDAWADAAGVTVPDGFHDAARAVAAAHAEPGPWCAFSHGDPAPTNNHVRPPRVRVLDFEYAAYRHVLYDLSAWNILCPMPDAVVAAMRESFRREFDARHAGARDASDRWADGWASTCAYRALAILTWLPLDVLEHDRPWADEWTMHGAAIAAMRRLSEVRGVARPIREFATRLAGQLAGRWGIDDPFPPFRVFRPKRG